MLSIPNFIAINKKYQFYKSLSSLNVVVCPNDLPLESLSFLPLANFPFIIPVISLLLWTWFV